MKSVFTLLALAAIALAAPLTTRDDAPSLSKLRSQVISGDSRFDGLFVHSYHTGAGSSDAVLEPDTGMAARGFLNGSSWQFDLRTDFPWGLNVYTDSNYAAWEQVTINAGESVSGNFFFNETAAPGLLWGYQSEEYEASEFRDWLACDWSHGVPQLFWHYRFYDYEVPSTCATIWLIPTPA